MMPRAAARSAPVQAPLSHLPTKQRAKNNYGRCTHCTAPYHDVAHVFAKADGNFDDCKALGLVNLDSRGDAENTLVLCANCHLNYDRHWKPALIIAPTHLGFFIEAEKRVHASNERKRIPPTSVLYAEYCHALDPTLDKKKGGQYTCYMDTPYNGDYGVQPGWNLVVQWAGDPMTMLYRAMSASRQILQPRGFPVVVRDQLQALNNLYMSNNKLFAAMAEAATQEGCPDGGHDGQGGNTRATPRPTTAPPPQAGHSSAAPAPNVEPCSHANCHVNSHANCRINSHAATGILSPPPSFPASPDKPPLHKRKRTELETEAPIEPGISAGYRKRAKVDTPVGTESSTREPTGLEYVWELFLQSTDTDPNQNSFNAEVSSITSETDTLPPPNAYDPIVDDKRFWRWEHRTAEDAIGYWRCIFLPMYAPNREKAATGMDT